MGDFKDFVLEEGPFWDAVAHGVRHGFREYRAKREAQKKQDSTPQAISKKLVGAEGDDLKSLVRQIVDNGYVIKNGRVCKPGRSNTKDWLLECTRTKTEFLSGN